MLGTVDDDVRARLIVLALITLFAILVGTTVLGIATNWPRHRTVPGTSSYQHPKTIDATVTALAATRCQVPAAHNCSNVTIRLDSGPNRGKTAVIRFGDTGSDAKVGLGDKLLVYKNPLPPGARPAGAKIPP